MSLRYTAAAALVLTFPLSGCVVAAVGAAGAVGLAAAQDKTLGEVVDDSAASGEIKSKLIYTGSNIWTNGKLISSEEFGESLRFPCPSR